MEFKTFYSNKILNINVLLKMSSIEIHLRNGIGWFEGENSQSEGNLALVMKVFFYPAFCLDFFLLQQFWNLCLEKCMIKWALITKYFKLNILDIYTNTKQRNFQEIFIWLHFHFLFSFFFFKGGGYWETISPRLALNLLGSWG